MSFVFARPGQRVECVDLAVPSIDGPRRCTWVDRCWLRNAEALSVDLPLQLLPLQVQAIVDDHKLGGLQAEGTDGFEAIVESRVPIQPVCSVVLLLEIVSVRRFQDLVGDPEVHFFFFATFFGAFLAAFFVGFLVLLAAFKSGPLRLRLVPDTTVSLVVAAMMSCSVAGFEP